MSEARERVGITVQEQTRYVEGHVAGAEWARTHLAQRATARARKAKTCPTCHGDVHVDLAGDIWTTTNAPTDAEELQRIIRRRNEEITLLQEVVEKQHQKLEEMERTFEVEKIEGVLSSLAIADEHNGSRNDHQLATLLYGKGMRVNRS